MTRRVSARIRWRFFFRRVLPYQRQHLPKSICALLLLGPVALSLSLTRIARWWWRRGEKIKSSDYYYPRPGTAAPSVFTNKQEELDVIMHLLLGCLFLIPPSACVNTAHRRNYDRTGPDYSIDSLMCSSFFMTAPNRSKLMIVNLDGRGIKKVNCLKFYCICNS